MEYLSFFTNSQPQGSVTDIFRQYIKEAIGTTGYIDKTGRLVLEVRWDIASVFHEGLAYVGVGDGFIGHKCGYIDRSGNLVIPIQWEDAGIFSGGYARVKDNNSIWRRIDKAGNYCNRNN